jgi:Uncharacterized Fe-S protein
MSEMKKKLNDLAVKSEMDYFGVAGVERFAALPEGHRPCDLLPGAKSVIVMGKAITQGPLTAQWNAFHDNRISILSFTMYCVNRYHNLLNIAALRAARLIEKECDCLSMPIPSGEPHDEREWTNVMSNRYAAACAGLGELVWNGFVATEKDGPRIMWVSVVTELELEEDPLYNGPQLCDHDKCGLCSKICPAHALSAEKEQPVRIDDAEMSYGKRNKPLCRCAVKGLIKGTPGRLQMDVPMDKYMKSMDDWLALTKKDDPWQRMEFNHGNYCLLCMTECPIGKKER